MAVSSFPVSIGYTHEFVRRSLPEGALRVLEVGAGDGALAEVMMADGFEVVAVDVDPEAVAAAAARGVDARLAEWPADIAGQFDAVLFTRSLHHVHALEAGIAAACRSLRPGGRIIVEDFKAEGGDTGTRLWATSLASLLADCGLIDVDALPAIADRLDGPTPDHDLHSSSAIRAELAKRGVVEEGPAAYYFRYFEPFLVDAQNAASILAHESALIASGSIDPLGIRFVLTPG